jgi:tRNA (mo5U34)-methyltransferase
MMLAQISPDTATQLIERTDFLWHQRFELCPGIFTPGVSDVDVLLDRAGIPSDLAGASVLDIGATNGGTSFALERRGATDVTAIDIYGPDRFGFSIIREALGSSAEFRQMSVYELSTRMHRQFDIVIFWGVLYHLRHPLLAIDNVRSVTGGRAYIETAVCDHETAQWGDLPVTRFYRHDELAGDGSNWFAPTVRTLMDWCHSCGLKPESVTAWPEDLPIRAMVASSVAPGVPEYQTLSYEQALHCSVADHTNGV